MIEISCFPSQIQKILAIISNKDKADLLDILGDKEIQKTILKLTQKEKMDIEDKKKNRIFSFIFWFCIW